MVVFCTSLASCGFTTSFKTDSSDATKAKKLARELSVSNGFDSQKYKLVSTNYVGNQGVWVVSFEEKGYFLALGEHFSVLHSRDFSKSKLYENTGYRNYESEKELQSSIQDFVKQIACRDIVVTYNYLHNKRVDTNQIPR